MRPIAATRLIPLHINKGKTIAQTPNDRTDYATYRKSRYNKKFLEEHRKQTQELLIARKNVEAIIRSRKNRNNTGSRNSSIILRRVLSRVI